MAAAGRSPGEVLRVAMSPYADDEDVQALRRAIPTFRRAARQDRGQRGELAEALFVLSSRQGERRKYRQAARLNWAAMRVFRRLAPRDPVQDPQAAAQLARCYGNLGLWTARSGFGGVRWSRKAVRIWEKLDRAERGKAEYCIGLGQSYMMLASRLLDQGRRRGARDAADTALFCYREVPAEQRPASVAREIGNIVLLQARLEQEGYGEREQQEISERIRSFVKRGTRDTDDAGSEAPPAPAPRSTREVSACGEPATHIINGRVIPHTGTREYCLYLCPEHAEPVSAWPGELTTVPEELLSWSCGKLFDYRDFDAILQSHADLWLTSLTGLSHSDLRIRWAARMPEVRERVAARADVREAVAGYELGLKFLSEAAEKFEAISRTTDDPPAEYEVLVRLGWAEKYFLPVRPPA
ncbi:tetratricopeptide (TPR) repeat protein [Kitasatospora sp. MAA4]|uniref:tetratricopeptide repeat protein n=1 Tax=Kitasatospora sp. MAA4 TaxID=3035093 RepID=UPI0024749226|nr:hypothetical protein [Kitasatospora sp. MAA4]MDH6135841.1 tetratricopeptide (TPR) repeat protein [Kitasatospora sp. MAA4]